jgi:type VI secretion system secreted protein Hcp
MAFDAFLKIEGIQGESQDKGHPGEIEITSFAWEVDNVGSGSGGGGAGRAVLQDFHFSMATSKASPSLMLASATGRHLPTATLTCRKAGFEFMKIKLSDVLVSSYRTAGETSDEFPTDELGLNFVKIDFLFAVQRTGETVEATFTQLT